MKKIFTTILFFLFLSLSTTVHAISFENITIMVDKEICSICGISLRTKLMRLDGINQADVKIKGYDIRIRYRADQVTAMEIVKVINSTSYKVKKVKR